LDCLTVCFAGWPRFNAGRWTIFPSGKGSARTVFFRNGYANKKKALKIRHLAKKRLLMTAPIRAIFDPGVANYTPPLDASDDVAVLWSFLGMCIKKAIAKGCFPAGLFLQIVYFE
jgi:hypothetical protein